MFCFGKIEIYESFQVPSTFGKMNVKNLQESSVKQCAEFKLKQFALRLQEHYDSMNLSQINEKAVKAEMVVLFLNWYHMTRDSGSRDS
jgi:hypothetical protein